MTITGETFLALVTDSIDLSECLKDGNKNDCDAVIRSFLGGKSESDDLLALFGSKLIASSSSINTCACLQEFDAGLEQCISVVDEYTNYCTTFYADVGSPSSIVDGVSMCVDAVKRECNIDTVEPSLNFFNQTMSCFKNNMQVLQSECYSILTSLLAGIFEACGYDLATICIKESASGSPGNTLVCLLSHYSDVSPTCRSQIDYLGQNMLPCADETARFCSDYSAPEDIASCLKFALDDGETGALFSNSCASMIASFSECLPSNNDDPSTAGDDYSDDKPKPKPRPRYDDNYDDYSDDKPKPKPRPRDDDNYDDEKPKPKPKPRPDDDTYVVDDKPGSKPKPKPKPQPAVDDFDDYFNDDNAYGGHAAGGNTYQNMHDSSSINQKMMTHGNVKANTNKARMKPQPFLSRKLNGDAVTAPCWAIAAGGGSQPKPNHGSDDDSKGGSNSGLDQSPGGPSDHGPPSPPVILFGVICVVAALCTLTVWYKNGRTFSNLNAMKSYNLLLSSCGISMSSEQYSGHNDDVIYARAPSSDASDDGDADDTHDIELVTRQE